MENIESNDVLKILNVDINKCLDTLRKNYSLGDIKDSYYKLVQKVLEVSKCRESIHFWQINRLGFGDDNYVLAGPYIQENFHYLMSFLNQLHIIHHALIDDGELLFIRYKNYDNVHYSFTTLDPYYKENYFKIIKDMDYIFNTEQNKLFYRFRNKLDKNVKIERTFEISYKYVNEKEYYSMLDYFLNKANKDQKILDDYCKEHNIDTKEKMNDFLLSEEYFELGLDPNICLDDIFKCHKIDEFDEWNKEFLNKNK